MRISDVYHPMSDVDRRQILSFTQALLTRVGEFVGTDVYFQPTDIRITQLLSKFPVRRERAPELDYVKRHFREDDVRAMLGVTKENEVELYTRLHCIAKALRPNPGDEKRTKRLRMRPFR